MLWTDDDLTAALALYEGELVAAHLRPTSVRSFVDYGRRFLRWRVGDYRPRNAAGLARARTFGTVDAVGPTARNSQL
jgi:hypothetical protein